jgi:hypothetical protein
MAKVLVQVAADIEEIKVEAEVEVLKKSLNTLKKNLLLKKLVIILYKIN